VGHPRYAGIDETMSIDQSLHSLFGVSKLAADVLAQEYGRYFGMATAVFRCGCVTGTGHAGTALHGFLSYLVRCFKEDRTYDVIGYAGKQVRDNIVSSDVVSAIDAYLQAELTGARVYNLGGGRANSCSIVEAVEMCREISGRSLTCRAVAQPRVGDHLWYISDLGKALTDLPGWRITAGLEDILTDMFDPQPAVL
jgi:CDP-paratose 2-epimerase